jgi:polyhydroxyalkanoate synthesis regulator phasin
MLEARVDRLEAALARLADAQARTEEQVAALAAEMKRLASEFSVVKGDTLEQRYRQHANAYFQSVLRRVRVVADEEFGRMVDDARQRGALTREEAKDLLLSDLIVLGRTWDVDVEAGLVVEVSSVIDSKDVGRAARRAALLERVTGIASIAVVAGVAATEDAEAEARAMGVWRVLDGRTYPPVVPGPSEPPTSAED